MLQQPSKKLLINGLINKGEKNKYLSSTFSFHEFSTKSVFTIEVKSRGNHSREKMIELDKLIKVIKWGMVEYDLRPKFCHIKCHCGLWCHHSRPSFTNCLWQRGWKMPCCSVMVALLWLFNNIGWDVKSLHNWNLSSNPHPMLNNHYSITIMLLRYRVTKVL